MGFNSTILVLNDFLDKIKEKPQEFAEAVYLACSGGMTSEQYRKEGWPLRHGQEMEVMSVVHNSATTVIAVGGNHHTILGHYYEQPHREEEDQIKLLKKMAKERGYRLVKVKK